CTAMRPGNTHLSRRTPLAAPSPRRTGEGRRPGAARVNQSVDLTGPATVVLRPGKSPAGAGGASKAHRTGGSPMAPVSGSNRNSGTYREHIPGRRWRQVPLGAESDRGRGPGQPVRAGSSAATGKVTATRMPGRLLPSLAGSRSTVPPIDSDKVATIMLPSPARRGWSLAPMPLSDTSSLAAPSPSRVRDTSIAPTPSSGKAYFRLLVTSSPTITPSETASRADMVTGSPR